MIPCDCHRRPGWVDLGTCELAERWDFLTGFVVGPWRDEFRAYTCPECATVWIVDECTRCPFALRVDTVEDLQTFDPQPYYRRSITASYGGLSEDECMFHGCTNRALKGVVFCIEHLG